MGSLGGGSMPDRMSVLLGEFWGVAEFAYERSASPHPSPRPKG